MRKAWLIGSVVILGVTAAAAAVGYRMQASKAQDEAKKAALANVTLEFTAAEVTRPRLDSMPQRIEFSGPLVAPRTAVVRARAPGTLLSLAVGEGSRVQAGQALGRIDLAELNSRVSERDAALDSAKAQFDQAKSQHQANQRLADQKFISANALETSAAALEAARAQLAAAQAQLKTSRVSLRDAALVSPLSGVVAKRHVLPGEKLSAEQNVLTLIDLSRLELAGQVGTHEVSLLQPGMAVQVKVEGLAQPVVGALARIAPAAEPGTRAIGVTIELKNDDERLRAGQYAVAAVQLKDPAQRLTVPASAIVGAAGQEAVWVIVNGALVRRAITSGRRDAARGTVEVLEGLSAESQVLAARFDNLKEGGKAVVRSAGSPVAAAAGVAAGAAGAASAVSR
jgi:membrane fusion protein, multidrug efflux system